MIHLTARLKEHFDEMRQNPIILLLLFLLTFIYFPLRKVFNVPESNLTGQYSDFSSFSLYISDILLITLCGYAIVSRGKLFKKYILLLIPLIAWTGFSLLINQQNQYVSLNIYYIIRYLMLFVSYATIATLTQKERNFCLKSFIILAVIQGIIALGQFASQNSLGLNILGEPILRADMPGVAKFISEGVHFIRGYGTFPHPNLLSAYLLAALLLNLHYLSESVNKWAKITYACYFFIILLGLFTTFSRAAFIATTFSIVIYFGILAIKKFHVRNSIKYGLFALVSLSIAITIFSPFLANRLNLSDHSTIERTQYSNIGLLMIADNPYFGVGIGESLLHMQQYAQTRLEPWEIQPIHNYFILAAAEMGIPGAIAFILVFLSFLIASLRKSMGLLTEKRSNATYLLALTAVLFGFLILMQFDHYFYTLQQTQILLWIVLGLIAAEFKNPDQVNQGNYTNDSR